MTKKVQYRCDDLPEHLREDCVDFTPSYRVGSAEEYRRKVTKCEQLAGDPKAFSAAGCKRLAHQMILGGRRQLRYGDYDYPRDAFWGTAEPLGPPVGTGEGSPASPARRERLADDITPMAARTQGRIVRDLTKARIELSRGGGYQRIREEGGTVEKVKTATLIRRAIDRYRKELQPADKELGFAVPSSAEPLIEMGMPARAANILVSRSRKAGRTAFYMAAPGLYEVEPLSLRMQIEAELGTGAALSMRGYEVVAAVGEGRRAHMLQKVLFVGPTGRAVTLSRASDIEDLYLRWREKVQQRGRELAAARDKAPTSQAREKLQRQRDQFLSTYGSKGFFLDTWLGSLNRKISAGLAARGDSGSRIVLNFKGAKEEIQITVPVGEHSKSLRQTADGAAVEYRSLARISLADLPDLLASLMHRKTRKGRRLEPLPRPLGKNNPRMVINVDLNQPKYQQLPAGATVPLAAYPGYVVYKNKDGILQVTTARRAQSWQELGEDTAAADALGLSLKAYRAQRGASRPSPVDQPFETRLAVANPFLENSDMHDYDDYPFAMGVGPYGGRQSLPTNRRNPKQKKSLTKKQILAGFAGKAAQERARKTTGRGRKKTQAASRSRSVRGIGVGTTVRCFTEAQILAGFGGKAAQARALGGKAPSRHKAAPKKSRSRSKGKLTHAQLVAGFGGKAAQRRALGGKAPSSSRSRSSSKGKLTHAQILAGFGGKAAQRRALGGKAPSSSRSRSSSRSSSKGKLTHAQLVAGFGGKAAQARALGGKAPSRSRSKGKQGTSKRPLTAKQIAAGFGGKSKQAAYRKAKGQLAAWNPESPLDSGWTIGTSPETDFWPHHPEYEQVKGQFGVSEAWTHGTQPANRRNPTGRWSKPCCICGGETQGTQIEEHPSMRGPQGGKKFAHTNCL